MSRLELFLLGGMRLTVDGQGVEINSTKALALLAYLGATDRRHDQESLASLLWSTSSPTRARANLRRTLWSLKQSPVADFIAEEQNTVGLGPEKAVWVDVIQLQRQISVWQAVAGQELTPTSVASLIKATSLYQDDFLTGLHLPDSPEFEEWVGAQREALRQDVRDALIALKAYHLDRGDHAAAEAVGRRQLQDNNLRVGVAAADALPMPVFLFTDIENSTRLWDEHREAMLIALHQHDAILAQHIEGHGGRVLGSRGDGVRAVFETGRPLEAAVAIQTAFGRADWGEMGELRIRIGLHAVPADWEGYDYFREGEAFHGPVMNYAARVMDTAWGGQIIVSENVKDALPLPAGGSWREFGEYELKGTEEPIRLYGLLHPNLPYKSFPPLRTPTRGQAPRPPFLQSETKAAERPAAFVARERELAELDDSLKSSKAGRGKTVFLIGGPGRGKTMLAQEFAQRAQEADDALIVISGNCNAHTGMGDPFLPFREALMMLTGNVEAMWAGGHITSQHARRLWELMPIALPALVEEAPDLIGTFLPTRALQKRAAAISAGEADWLAQLAAIAAAERRENLQRKRVLAQYTRLLKVIARERPLLIILEDLHWIDASSGDLLFHLSREAEDSAILIVGTYRPEEVALTMGQDRHPLAGVVSELKRRYGDIWLDLGNVTRLEGRQFVDAYLKTEPNRLSESFKEALYQHTGGHALFTVELLREMQERQDLRRDEDGYWVTAGDIDWQAFPAKVEGLIERRIGRLEEDLQAVLRVASVEGELFTAEIVARVQTMDERELVHRLSRELVKQHRLLTVHALERLGTQRLSLYRFRHHLFQHYLYHSMDEVERAYLHEEVGNVLEAIYGGQNEEVAIQLARHFELAGLIEKAIDYLHLSGQKDIRQSANLEAIDHLTHGLELLKTLPASSERNLRELDLQIGLGVAQQMTKGLAALEAQEAYSRARELAKRAGETPALFPVLFGLWLYYSVRSAHQKADELAQQLLALAKQAQDPALLLPAHRALGSGLFWTGDFIVAQEHLNRVITDYQSQRHHSLVVSYGGSDIKVVCLYFSSLIVGWSGYPERALELSRESLSLSQEVAHTYSLVAATWFAGWLRASLRAWQAAQDLAETSIKLATEHGSQFWLAAGLIVKGCAIAGQGQLEEGILVLRQGLDAYQATGGKVFISFAMACLAEFLGKAGQIDKAIDVLASALATIEETEERFWEAELYRLKGELLLARNGSLDRVESNFTRAIEVAQQQQVKLLELRAMVSLCRLWQAQGKSEIARRKLAEHYGWFTEGFDTPDLRQARSLLEALTDG